MEATNKSQSNDLQFTFSYFNNLWSKDSITISLSDLHQRTLSPLWKPRTESYRKLKSNPKRDNEAKMTKDSMPVVIAEIIRKVYICSLTNNRKVCYALSKDWKLYRKTSTVGFQQSADSRWG